MSFLKSFLALSPRTRILIGVSFVAWGSLGPYVTDRAGTQLLGLKEASEEDEQALGRAVPTVQVVEREG